MNFKESLPYIFPFLLFGFLTYLFGFLIENSLFAYPLKIFFVSFSIIFFFKKIKQELVLKFDIFAVIVGIIVFCLWVGLEGFYPAIGNDNVLNPFENSNQTQVIIFILFRMLGASIIVPLIEELFWRSFAMRFLIDSDFTKVPAGTFSWFSFVVVSVAFGFEHYRWLPGIFAGILYGLVYIRTKNLFSCVVSHSITNFMLGVYVLYTGYWSFW
ncbi:MAG: CAAX prenyl protease-related protein [Deltaproteobacteria bacterium]|nr:MAG: CAAX prenyl protease-related protein [Deltaproteobacteria bacterium]